MAIEEKKKLNDPFSRKKPDDIKEHQKATAHVYGDGIKCKTDVRGKARPQGKKRSAARLVVDATDGFIPLWAKNTVLRWRFEGRSLEAFDYPEEAKEALRHLMGEALLKWSDAVPVKFSERQEAWDFEVAIADRDDCDGSNCVWAEAFFPDSGRHQLIIYPIFFDGSLEKKLATLAHEFGHIFGLRHFFANIKEKDWPVEIVGKHQKFTIMNYGPNSYMTKQDRDDLKKLYKAAWSGDLTHINATPIRLMKPFSTYRH